MAGCKLSEGNSGTKMAVLSLAMDKVTLVARTNLPSGPSADLLLTKNALNLHFNFYDFNYLF